MSVLTFLVILSIFFLNKGTQSFYPDPIFIKHTTYEGMAEKDVKILYSKDTTAY